MMNRFFAVIFLFILLLLLLTMPGCTCGDDDDDDDSSFNDDDSSADDDDDTPDDDVSDDDNDDNDTDDDDDDDNDDDPVFDYPADPGVWVGDIFFQQIAGGSPGDTRTGLGIGPDGTRYVVAECGDIIYFYTCDENADCTREIVDYWGFYPDLAVDSQGYAHICFADDWDYYDWDLKYATNKSGTWEVTELDQTDDVGALCSITVDANDHAHIAYYDATNSDLKYATDKSGSWMVESAVTDGDAGILADIAVDTNGYAHITFANNSEGLGHAIFYATNKTGSWEYEGDFNGIALYSSIAVDDNGFIHIAHDTYHVFPDDADNNLVYTTNKSGSWQSVLVDTDTEVGLDPSIAIDSSGYLHISYWSRLPEERLRYATNKSGTWEITVVDGKEGEGLYSSLAIDSDDNIHISHHDWDRERLLITKLAGSSQTTTIIDSASPAGSPAMGLIDYDKPYVIYSDSKNDVTKYAIRNDGYWDIETIDIDVNIYMKRDQNGFLHFSYTDMIGGIIYLNYSLCSEEECHTELLQELRKVQNTPIDLDAVEKPYIGCVSENGAEIFSMSSGIWSSEIIDSAGIEVYDLAVDVNDIIHVVFSSDDGLYYGLKENGAWSTALVDGSETAEASMKIDSDGFVHILYYINAPYACIYATNKSGAWVLEELEIEGNRPRIDVDDEGYVHIINGWGGTAVDLSYYMTNSTGDWEITTTLPGVSFEFQLDSTNTIQSLFLTHFAVWYAAFPAGYYP